MRFQNLLCVSCVLALIWMTYSICSLKKEMWAQIVYDEERTHPTLSNLTTAETPAHLRTFPSKIHKFASPKPHMMTYVHGIGRFGNWLFQYASTFAIAQKTGHQFVIEEGNPLNDIFPNLSATLHLNYRSLTHYENQSMIFSPNLFNIVPSANTRICCYLQSWKYFYEFTEDIRQEFRPSNSLAQMANSKLTSCKQAYVAKFAADSPVFVGVHVRRGDVASHSAKKQGFSPAPKEFVSRAFQYYRDQFKDVVFVMASDARKWCLKQFQREIASSEVCLPLGRSFIEDFTMLSKCNHSIMTVGSFGWWASYMANGSVVYYHDWPLNGSSLAAHIKYEDYFPPSWIPL